MKWRVILEPDSETGDWSAWCPELPGCASAGQTQEEALANIREAIELYLQPDAVELGSQGGQAPFLAVTSIACPA